MSVKNYRDLIVWQKSMDLVEGVYFYTSEFPTDEKFGLISQIRRCAVSIPSNIAEGSSRKGAREFIRFLDISNGSLKELETQLIISHRLNFLQKAGYDKLLEKTEEIGRIIWALRKSLINKIGNSDAELAVVST